MEQRKPLALTAREKDILLFEEIGRLFPEEIMGEFVACLSSPEPFYRPTHADIFNKFIVQSERASWKFLDKQVQDYYENFKETRASLDSFLLEHFGQKGTTDLIMHLELKETPFWNKLKIEIGPLIKTFHHTYKVFIENSAKILYNKESRPISRRKAPSTYVNNHHIVYMVIGKDKIRIAKENTRQSKLWRGLIKTFGIPRSIDSVFDNIWIPKDKDNTLLELGHKITSEQKKIIQTTIKDLQKILSTHQINILDFKIEDGNVWMEWRGKIK